MIWFAVKPRKPLSRLLIYVPTELGSDPDLISKWFDRLAEDPLVFEWPVCLGTVEERNATIVGCAQNADHFRPVRYRGLVPPMHVLNAQPDFRDLQLAEPSSPDRRIGGALRIIPRSGLGTCLILRSGQRRKAGARKDRLLNKIAPVDSITFLIECFSIFHFSSLSAFFSFNE